MIDRSIGLNGTLGTKLNRSIGTLIMHIFPIEKWWTQFPASPTHYTPGV